MRVDIRVPPSPTPQSSPAARPRRDRTAIAASASPAYPSYSGVSSGTEMGEAGEDDVWESEAGKSDDDVGAEAEGRPSREGAPSSASSSATRTTGTTPGSCSRRFRSRASSSAPSSAAASRSSLPSLSGKLLATKSSSLDASQASSGDLAPGKRLFVCSARGVPVRGVPRHEQAESILIVSVVQDCARKP